MKNKLIIYFFILQFTLQGQSTQMSLNQLLELAKQNNSDVQQSIVKTQSLQYQKKSIALFDKTSLNATMGQNNSFLRDANYQISQSVVNPYKYMLQTKTAQQKIVVNELETESYIKKLHLKISQHWYKALLYKQMKKAIVQEDSLIKEFVRIAEAKVKYGETRPLELSNAKIEAMNVQQEIQEVELMYQQELVAIALLSNQEKIIEPNEDELQLLPTPLSKNVSDQHIGITLANSYLDLAKSNTKVAKFSFLPDFQLGYTIQSFTGPQEVEGVLKYYDSKPRFQSVSFGLTLPLLNWKSNASFRKSS
ncbi:MAG: TolC family protein, partial [Saprospiraceae bacterium]